MKDFFRHNTFQQMKALATEPDQLKVIFKKKTRGQRKMRYFLYIPTKDRRDYPK